MYFPFGKIFNKGLKEEDKKEGLLKALRNIEHKNEDQLKAIEDQRKKQLVSIKNIDIGSKLAKVIASFSRLDLEVEKLIDEIKDEQNATNFGKLLCVKTDGKTYFNFCISEDSQKLASDIYYYCIRHLLLRVNEKMQKMINTKIY